MNFFFLQETFNAMLNMLLSGLNKCFLEPAVTAENLHNVVPLMSVTSNVAFLK